MARDVVVDHEEISAKTREMEGVLTDLMSLRTGMESIVEKMIQEASVATASGQPSPAFGPLINSTQAAVKRLQKSLDAVHHRVAKDMEILTEMSKQVAQQGEDAAQSINTADTAFDRGSTPA